MNPFCIQNVSSYLEVVIRHLMTKIFKSANANQNTLEGHAVHTRNSLKQENNTDANVFSFGNFYIFGSVQIPVDYSVVGSHRCQY